MSRPRPAQSLRGAAALAAAAATSLCAPTSAAAADFSVPPASLPASNGALVRTEPMKLGASITLNGLNVVLPGKATRIMYRSNDANGLPVAVTGTYIEPSKAWPGTGPRPLVSFAEGTQGQGDQCAPSRTLASPLSVSGGSLAVGYEVPGIYGFLNKGIAVVVTDYIGLGTPDRTHTYVDRKDMGQAVLDAAIAAMQVGGASVTQSSPVGVYGYSQGGGAAASAAELQPTYAPSLNLKAGYAGAPPANLMEVLRSADGTALVSVLGYAINGLAVNNPVLRPILDAEVNAAGKAALAKISTQCIGDSLFAFAYKRTSSWTVSGRPAYDVVNGNPAARAVVDAQRIGTLRPTVPVQILTGTRDDLVDHGQARQLAVDWCARGADVYYKPVTQYFDAAKSGLNHLGPAIGTAGSTTSWMIDRLKGLPQTSNCASISRLP